MISPGKYAKLPPSAKKRKLLRLCEEWLLMSENDWIFCKSIVRDILMISYRTEGWSRRLKSDAKAALDGLRLFPSNKDRGYARLLMRLVSSLREELGLYAADWDGFYADGEKKRERTVLPIRLYLEDLRSPYNVGSIFRTAEAMGGEKIYLGGTTPSVTNPRAMRTARGADSIITWEIAELESIADNYTVFALETGGTPVDDFAFPDNGLMIVGSEELGVSQEALELAEKKGAGRLSIPLSGLKGSLNVSVATGIALYFWKKSLLSN